MAHACDGNLHWRGPIGAHAGGGPWPSSSIRAAAERVVRTALDLSGTNTVEHVVCALKWLWLGAALGEQQLVFERSMKAVFDPLGLLAPASFLAR